MRAVLPYILLFFGSLVIVVLVMAAVMWYRPDLLGMAAPGVAAVPDSVKTAARPSTLTFYGPTLAELNGMDSLALARGTVASLRDSLQMLCRLLEGERAQNDSLRNARGGAVPPATVAAADSSGAARADRSAERKAMLKMLETMRADNVVRLLNGMSDDEVKELLLTLKTKQAAKILAALDPDRAAKLIR